MCTDPKSGLQLVQMVCESCVAPDPRIRIAAFQCLHEIAASYYQHLQPYMQQVRHCMAPLNHCAYKLPCKSEQHDQQSGCALLVADYVMGSESW